MSNPIRILNIVGNMGAGGYEALIMNLYRNVDREKVQFDFLTHNNEPGVYDKEILELGGRIYHMPEIRTTTRTYYHRIFKYISALKKFFKEHPEYHIIHGHMTNTAAIYIPIAKKYGKVSCAIAHSHMTQDREGLLGIITKILHKPIPKIATDFFSCSERASHWIFNEELISSGQVKVIKNGVDPKRFYYSAKQSKKGKEEMGLVGKVVFGHVGRFKTEKNHSFLIEIFNEIKKKEENAVLLLIGDGEHRAEIEKKILDLNLQDSVRMLGVRGDVQNLMSVMDVFLLPSMHEGLPVVGVEAQAAGLPMLTSTGVTAETDITGNVTFLELSAGAEKWAEEALKIYHNFKRRDMYDYISSNGYDITKTAGWLQDFYIDKHNEVK